MFLKRVGHSTKVPSPWNMLAKNEVLFTAIATYNVMAQTLFRAAYGAEADALGRCWVGVEVGLE